MTGHLVFEEVLNTTPPSPCCISLVRVPWIKRFLFPSGHSGKELLEANTNPVMINNIGSDDWNIFLVTRGDN